MSFKGLLALLPSLLVIMGCASAAAPSLTATPISAPTSTSITSVSFPLIIKDSLGRDIIIEKAPLRIVSFSPAATEIFYAIGAGDKVVGTDDFSDYPPEAKSKPKVGYSNIDIEKVVSIQPDLVYAATRQKRYVPELEKVGLKVLYLEEPGSVDGVFDQIKNLGNITNHPQEAKRLTGQMQGRISAIQQKLANVETGPRVFYELTPELFTAGPDTFIGGIFNILKAQNIAAAASRPYPQLSQETLVEKDPELIVLGDAATYGLGKESPATVKQRPGWGNISAVKRGGIYEIDSSLISRPGPRIVDGLEALAKMFYPEQFP